MAHVMWTHNPGPRVFPITQLLKPFAADTLESVERFGRAIYGERDALRDPKPEPFCEDLPIAETGYWIQGHLFGGSSWPLICHGINPRFLSSVPSGMAMEFVPRRSGLSTVTAEQTAADPNKNVLAYPPLPWEDDRVHIRVSQLRAYFNQDFWAAEVARYGHAALFFRTARNTKIYASDPATYASTYMAAAMARHQLSNELFVPKNSISFVRLFLTVLFAEQFEVHLMLQRWNADQKSRRYRDEVFKALLIECRLHALELAMCSQDLRKAQELSPEEHERWRNEAYVNMVETVGRFESHAQEHLKETFVQWPLMMAYMDGRFSEFWNDIRPRLVASRRQLEHRLRKAHTNLMREVATYQNFLGGLWRMSDQHRAQFLALSTQGFGVYIRAWLTKVNAHCENLIHISSLSHVRAVVMPIAHEFLHAREKIQALMESMVDLNRRPPEDWGESLCLLPRITRSKRPTSMRWLRTAQKEIRLLNNEQIQNIDRLLHGLRGQGHAAAALVDSKVTDPVEAVGQLAEYWESSEYAFLDNQEPFPPNFGIVNPDVNPPASDPHGSEPPLSLPAPGPSASGMSSSASPPDDAAQDDAVQDATAPDITAPDTTSPDPSAQDTPDLVAPGKSSGQQKHGVHIPPGQKRLFKLKSHVKELPGLNHPVLPHAQPFSVGPSASQDSQPTYPKLPTGLSGKWSGPPSVPTPIPPTVQSPWLDYGTNVPAHSGLFPHPYALNASVTDDLVHQVALVVYGGQDSWNVPEDNPAFHTLQDSEDDTSSSGSTSSSDSDSELGDGSDGDSDSGSDDDDDGGGDEGGAVTGASGDASSGAPGQNQGSKRRKRDEDDEPEGKKKRRVSPSRKRKRDDDGYPGAGKKQKTANLFSPASWPFKWPVIKKT
ncbi:hypothetical protein ACRALDRAFT_1078481 [Sodiomyces alcalophilus JCM 7366]|uniref:uncharacterized protein n=1 Tax=Sodiomyces alcalophilus JCM 7366 TaxID=591952 RepID=UPI0039B4E3AF